MKGDLGADLIAAAKRDRAPEGARARAFDRVASAAGAEPVSEAVAGPTSTASAPPRRRFSYIRMPAAFALAGGLVAVLTLTGGGMYIKNKGEESARAQALAAAQLADTQKQLDALNGELAAQNARVEAATAALADAKDESAKQHAAAQLAMAQNELAKTRSAVTSFKGGGATKAASAAKACTCAHSDPLCGCIQ